MQTSQAQQKNQVKILWQKAATIQEQNGNASPGFAGPLNGITNGFFITAGGANFPGGLPWQGGKKVYHNFVYLFKIDGANLHPVPSADTLPEPIAYAGTTTVSDGIVYAGGENQKGLSKKAYLVSYNFAAHKLQFRQLPDLPAALTNIALASHGKTIYAAGGDLASASSSAFLKLELEADNEHMEWERLPDLPLPLANSALISLKNKLYLIGGRTKTASGISELHNTVFSFDLATRKWQQHGLIMNNGEPMNLSAAAVTKIDDDQILVVGGDDGRVFHQIETLISKINQADEDSQKEKLTAQKTELQSEHQGFNRSLLLYDANRDKWTNLGDYPFPAQVTTTAVLNGRNIIVSNGEVKPGVRTPLIITGTIK